MKKAVMFFTMLLTMTMATAGCGTKVDVTASSSQVSAAASADSSMEDASGSGSAADDSGTSDADDGVGSGADRTGASGAEDSGTDGGADGKAEDGAAGDKQNADTTADTGDGSTLLTSYESLDPDDMFSNRDQDASYDASGATRISLDGTSASVSGSGAEADGSTVTITGEGTYLISGTLTDGQIVVEADDSEKVQLVLNGVTITNDDSACILVRSADKVFITLADGTTNTLSDTGAEYVQESGDYTVDGVIFSRDDLTLNGSGTLVVSAGYKHAIVSKDDLVITGGTYEITAQGKGLAGKDSVRIQDGTVTVTAEDDAIHTSNSEDAGKGFIYIAGGTLTLASGDDGIHAETALVIAGGTIDVTESYEGLEGATIDITDGVIHIKASDDGMNAAISDGDADHNEGMSNDGQMFGRGGFGGGMMDAQPDAYLRISGGTIYVDADGDGLDSNGMLYIDGGTTTVAGPTNNGNGALDYGTGAEITGGTIIATGSSGMAETFGSGSAQYSIQYNFDSSVAAGTEVSLIDASGNTVLTVTPDKTYQSVIFSSSDIGTGTYTVKAGSTEAEIEVTDVVTKDGATGGMMGGRGGWQDEGFGGQDGGGSMQRPGDGELPQMQDGEPPQMQDGEPPQMQDGELPQMGDGERPQPGDGAMPGGGRGGKSGRQGRTDESGGQDGTDSPTEQNQAMNQAI